MSGVANTMDEVVMTYLTTHWTRTEIALIDSDAVPPDPGYGNDEVCPVIYYSQPFDPSDDAMVQAMSDYTATEIRGKYDGAWIDGVGYLVVNIEEIDATPLDMGSRGATLARDRVMFIIFAPPENATRLAKDYAGAIAALFHGVDLIPASGIQRVWNWVGENPVQQTPNDLGTYNGMHRFLQSIVLHRQYRRPRAGLQSITA